MQNDTDKLIEDQLKSLPLNLQRAISIIPWRDLVREIGKDSDLNAEQVKSLEQETLLIIYGFEPPENYSKNIVRELGIDENEALDIVDDISEEVLELIDEKAKSLEKNTVSAKVPEIALETHPMVEEGEIAHDVPLPEKIEEHTEPKEASAPENLPTEELPSTPSAHIPEIKPVAPASLEPKQEEEAPEPSKPSYAPGQDPYREPIE